jgi:putative transcriptional regulator
VVLADFVDAAHVDDLVVDSVGFLPGALEDSSEVGQVRALRVFAGYAGWSPGQLEEELEEGSWLVLPARASDVFGDEPERLWSKVLRRQGGALAVLALLPDDPGMN